MAVLGSQDDMGALVSLYGKPQQYARFLHGEFAAGPAAYRLHSGSAARARSGATARAARAALLVVMPNGYGVAGPVAAAARDTVQRTSVDARNGLSLGEASVKGVAKLAAASGRRIDVPVDPIAEGSSPDTAAPSPAVPATPAAAHGSPSGAPWGVIGAGVAVLMALAAVALIVARRRARAANSENMR